jgi:hypothetical protein
MTYSLSMCPVHSPTFVKGKATQKFDDFDTVDVAVTHVVYGDLDGDGLDEAVVVTECYSGQSADFEDEHVFTMDGDHPRLLGRIDGEDGGIDSVTIKAGALIVDRPDGPHKDERFHYRHGRVQRTVYRWDGSRMMPIGQPKVIQKHPPAPLDE